MARIIENRIVGYQNYEAIHDKLKKLFLDAFCGDNPYFILAVNEAVCNAARYSILGPTKAKITIRTEIGEADIRVKISSATTKFDAMAYQHRLRKLAADSKYKNMACGDYTSDTDMSRGFWYMLEAVDYLVIDSDGEDITLSARIPYDYQPLDPRIGYLVPKFFVRKNGVIQ